MKKCPFCGMSNGSMNTVCLNCWKNLTDVEDEPDPPPMFSDKMAGQVLSVGDRAMDNVLRSKHDSSFKPSSVLLAGVFVSLILLYVNMIVPALIVISAAVLLAGLFYQTRRSNRRL